MVILKYGLVYQSAPVTLYSRVSLVNTDPCVFQERDTKCFYGDKCRFLHDVSEYMSTKAADLGDQCYLFNTFGKCHYGVTCRFAKAHTSAELKNLVNEDLYKPSTERETVRNHLDKDLQRQLRKKQVSFKGAEAYLKTITRGKKLEENQSGPRDADNTPETKVKHQYSYGYLILESKMTNWIEHVTIFLI